MALRTLPGILMAAAMLMAAPGAHAAAPVPLASPQTADIAARTSVPVPIAPASLAMDMDDTVASAAPMPLPAPQPDASLPDDAPIPVQLADAAPQSAPISGSAKIWSPEILSGKDRELYLKIFAAEKKAHWKTADRLIARLSDTRLMGYVLFDRYMHPRYRSSYAELRAWMAEFSDLPGADRIYRLALRKKPRAAAAPTRPQPRRWRAPVETASVADKDDAPNYSAQFEHVDRKVRQIVRDRKARDAMRYLNRPRIRNALSDLEYDKARLRVATSYFIENDNANAYETANDISQAHGRNVPLADWYAGLAAWRMNEFGDAARHFDRLARASNVSDWSRAAGGFWAARAYLADHEPEHVAEMLEIASKTGATFYGLLATRQLGREPHFNWIEPALDRKGFESLIQDSAVARAVALVQIGRRDLAEQELLRALGWLDPGSDEAIIALASTFKLAAVELQAASAANPPQARLHDGAITLNAGLYPVPEYKPKNGFRVDRALFYAVMRQESKFRADAKSGAGARGLMQIMPATASVIAQDRTLARRNKNKLLDPSFNLSLAQDYIETLMASGEPQGNLFMLTTAYNGGPGNLSRWIDQINFKGDPFLFIESIPAPETRHYIERVVTNFWIYRSRLGQPNPSLDDSASGDWPVYNAVETPH
jgi:soluble lytic murein transglycosylase-like protein